MGQVRLSSVPLAQDLSQGAVKVSARVSVISRLDLGKSASKPAHVAVGRSQFLVRC